MKEIKQHTVSKIFDVGSQTIANIIQGKTYVDCP